MLGVDAPVDAGRKKRTFTNRYNQRPAWLQNLHATLDRAVWDAYDCPACEVPGEVAEEVVLEKLLALNREPVGGNDGEILRLCTE